MLLSLRVRKVGALIGVQRETETTFQGTEVVAKNVRVLDSKHPVSTGRSTKVTDALLLDRLSPSRACANVPDGPHCSLTRRQHHHLQTWTQPGSDKSGRNSTVFSGIITHLVVHSGSLNASREAEGERGSGLA
jgi:hypothetical protein